MIIQKKICMLGSFAVGKTSLVRRFVDSIYTDKYLTTVGVKIDKKVITIGADTVNLILWDIQGEDELQKLRMTYLRGYSGYLLIVDGTRRETLDVAFKIKEKTEAELGVVPHILVFNKSDLVEDWEIEPELIEDLKKNGWHVLVTSAKLGTGVEEAFIQLAERMIEKL